MIYNILKIYCIALLLGMLTGVVASFFYLVINFGISSTNNFLLFLNAKGLAIGIISIVISITLVFIAWIMVKKISPEASGSGVQEIEGALMHVRPMHWARLLPTKFIGGVLAISSKLVLGREGPTIQLGGNLGQLVGSVFKLPSERVDALIAAGAAAGLASAFNAPLAGVLFILEEMRSQFIFSFVNFKIVAITCVMATITLHAIIGSQPAIPMHVFDLPSLKSLWLFFIFGIVVGFCAVLFNKSLLGILKFTDALSTKERILYIVIIGGVVGFLAVYFPAAVGGGYDIIEQSLTLSLSFHYLLTLIIFRFFTTIFSYSTGVPGGIFAPLLALGTLIGLGSAFCLQLILPDETVHPAMFAVAGMGALFSASIRAPITGIILVVEMTQNYSLILPLMVSCLTSTTVMQLTQSEPIYTQLLNRSLKKLPK